MSNKHKDLEGKLFKVHDEVSDIIVMYPDEWCQLEHSIGIVVKNPKNCTAMYTCMINKRLVLLFDNEMDII